MKRLRDQSAFGWQQGTARNSLLRTGLDCARRRRLWILLITLGISLTTGVVAVRLPNVYRAETVLTQVHPPKVSEGVVPPAAAGSMPDRYASIQQEVLSPMQLGGLIKELHLYPKMLGKVSDQALIRSEEHTSELQSPRK